MVTWRFRDRDPIWDNRVFMTPERATWFLAEPAINQGEVLSRLSRLWSGFRRCRSEAGLRPCRERIAAALGIEVGATT